MNSLKKENQMLKRRNNELLRNLGLAQTGIKHENMYNEFGYPEDVETSDLLALRQRNALAFSVIDKIIKKTWETLPEIVEPDSEEKSDTPFEIEINRFMKKHMDAFKEADNRSLYSDYVALLVIVRDGQSLSQPLKKIQSLDAIVEFKPIYNDQLTVISRYNYEKDPYTYGKPLMYQYEEPILDQNNEETSSRLVDIHHSRLIMVSEFGVSSGTNRLKVAFNSALDAQKVAGSASEGYWKNSSSRLHVNFEGNGSGINSQSADELNDKYTEQIDSLNRGFDKAFITRGASVSPMVASMSDPHSTFMINVSMVATAFDIATTIAIGQQTGRLASDEDSKQFALTCQSRRVNTVDKMLHSIIDFVMKIGAIALTEYKVKWGPLTEPTDIEKIEGASKLAEINVKTMQSMGSAVFTINEIRIKAGYEPIPEGDTLLSLTETEGDPNQDE